jgi:hypothetical protein
VRRRLARRVTVRIEIALTTPARPRIGDVAHAPVSHEDEQPGNQVLTRVCAEAEAGRRDAGTGGGWRSRDHQHLDMPIRREPVTGLRAMLTSVACD